MPERNAPPEFIPVIDAVRTLAGRCDGARQRDNVGFSGADAWVGRFISLMPDEEWTPDIISAAANMLHKYERQLQSAGFSLDAIARFVDHDDDLREDLKVAARRIADQQSRLISFSESADRFHVQFRYADADFGEIRSAVSRVQGSKWDRQQKVWSVPKEGASAMLWLANEMDFELDEGVDEHLEQEAEAYAEVVREELADQAAEGFTTPDGGDPRLGFRIAGEVIGGKSVVTFEFPYDGEAKRDLQEKFSHADARPRWTGTLWQVDAWVVDTNELEEFAVRHGFQIHEDLYVLVEDAQLHREALLEERNRDYRTVGDRQLEGTRRVYIDDDELVFEFPFPKTKELTQLKEAVSKRMRARFDASDKVWRRALPKRKIEEFQEKLDDLAEEHGIQIHHDVDEVLEEALGTRPAP